VSTVYLGLGTNLGDRRGNLQRAVDALVAAVAINAVSPVYETRPWGIENQPNFLNMCVAGETKLAPLALMHHLKELEFQLGREQGERWGPRLIDIDILFYDELILDEPLLTIPHKGVADRATVLVPLAQIAPELVHPILQQKVVDLVREIDVTGVWQYASD
jgi:2-amino-4-hydroxy-6-hydroxymethyldihydropteridine diphosphokinase